VSLSGHAPVPLYRHRCRCGYDGNNYPAHIDEAAGKQRQWFLRTGHCGACGNPGSYCTCTVACGCDDLHEVGSGLRPDALDQFAEVASVPVSDEQAELF